MLKAISLWQPYASAVELCLKRNETRGWSTKYRGELGIVSTMNKAAALRMSFNNFCGRFHHFQNAIIEAGYVSPDPNWPAPKFNSLPFGQLLCIVDIVDCFPTDDFKPESELERYLGDYSPGRFVWKLENVRRLKNPVSVIGRQGFFYIPAAIEKKVRAQIC